MFAVLSLVLFLAQGAVPAPRAPKPLEYTVGPQDVIQVLIHGHEDLSRRDGVEIDSDGTVEYPLIGRITVEGLTTREIADLIRATMVRERYLTGTPTVTVTVREFRSQFVNVTGEVHKPGSVTLNGPSTLSDVLSKAGYFTKDAGTHVEIVRASLVPGAGERIRVERTAIDEGGGNRILIGDGDAVHVPRAQPYFIDGQVAKPGPYTHQPGLTVLQAAITAGGFTERAAKNRLQVRRMVNGVIKTIRVKENDLVQPGDTIVVPARWVL